MVEKTPEEPREVLAPIVVFKGDTGFSMEEMRALLPAYQVHVPSDEELLAQAMMIQEMDDRIVARLIVLGATWMNDGSGGIIMPKKYLAGVKVPGVPDESEDSSSEDDSD